MSDVTQLPVAQAVAAPVGTSRSLLSLPSRPRSPLTLLSLPSRPHSRRTCRRHSAG